MNGLRELYGGRSWCKKKKRKKLRTTEGLNSTLERFVERDGEKLRGATWRVEVFLIQMQKGSKGIVWKRIGRSLF